MARSWPRGRYPTIAATLSATVCSALVLAAITAPLGAQEVFSDGFEVGDLDAWTTQLGAEPPVAFRLTDFDLRDPHLFVSAIVCFDFTDTPLPGDLGPSFNDGLEAQLTGDADLDGFLDSSLLLLFRPLDTGPGSFRVDLRPALCSAPPESTVCSPDPAAPPTILSYSSLGAGTCFAPELSTTSSYVPGIQG